MKIVITSTELCKGLRVEVVKIDYEQDGKTHTTLVSDRKGEFIRAYGFDEGIKANTELIDVLLHLVERLRNKR